MSNFQPGDVVICVTAAMPCRCTLRADHHMPTVGLVCTVESTPSGVCPSCRRSVPAFVPAEFLLPYCGCWPQAMFRKLRPAEIATRAEWAAMLKTKGETGPTRHSREIA